MKSQLRLARSLDGAPWRKSRWAVALRSAAVVSGAALVVAVAGWTFAGGPAKLSPDGGVRVGTGRLGVLLPGPPAGPSARSSFSGIVLPDLLIVLPAGLTRSEITALGRIGGVRKLVTFDGARITVAGKPASVIGVDPGQFRSWVPLRTASDQRLWTKLAAGDFIATSAATARLRLGKAVSYRLSGRSAVRVPFGGAAKLGIAGVDVVVDRAVSRKLGLVHEVAALISAPGQPMTTLTSKVRRVLGSGARLVSLRGQQAAIPSVPSHISNYLQLFHASAAKYCPRLSWTVLAAIGQIESADGRDVGPSSAGALGPMQFLPSTWAAWGIDGFGPPGLPDVMNPFDAVPSAARMLCAEGASTGTQAGLRRAIFAYNHADWYVADVLALAAEYAADYRI
jgi:hypothetical protein